MAGVVIFTRNVWKICASIWFWTQVPVQKIHSYLHLFCIRICICMQILYAQEAGCQGGEGHTYMAKQLSRISRLV